MATVQQQINKIIRETLNLNPAAIDKTMPWYDMGIESSDLVELIITLREQFQLKILVKDLNKLDTLNDLVVYIEKQLAKK